MYSNVLARRAFALANSSTIKSKSIFCDDYLHKRSDPIFASILYGYVKAKLSCSFNFELKGFNNNSLMFDVKILVIFQKDIFISN